MLPSLPSVYSSIKLHEQHLAERHVLVAVLACPTAGPALSGERLCADLLLLLGTPIETLPKNVKPEISRFKGLGEMPASDLKETTINPRRRRALRVNIEDALMADQTISQLMGKDPQARYDFIMSEASTADAEALDL